jgi:transposase
MKKNNTVKQSLKKGTKKTTKDAKESITIGMDLGDKTSRYCILNGSGEVREEGSVPTSKKGMMQMFGAMRRYRIAMEVGGHSPWVSCLLSSLGYEVIVANARQVNLISTSSRKNDRLDARVLARLPRMDDGFIRSFPPHIGC